MLPKGRIAPPHSAPHGGRIAVRKLEVFESALKSRVPLTLSRPS